MAKLPPPEGSLPVLEIKDDTDPDVFAPRKTRTGYLGQDSDTVPRCMTCGRASEDIPSFDRGVIYALQGVRWMLKQRMTEAEADHLVLWLKQGIIGGR